MAIAKPTDDQIDTAIQWLESFESEDGNESACHVVAGWLDELKQQRFVRGIARSAGVPVDAVRKRLKATMTATKGA